MTEQAKMHEQMSKLTEDVQKTVESFRKPLGELVSEAGESGEHPLGVALALSLAAATVIATVCASAGMPKPVMALMLEGMLKEAKEAADMTFDVISSAVKEGGTEEEISQALKEAANK